MWRNIKTFWITIFENNTYSECVFVALVIRHEARRRHILVRGLSSTNMFFPHYLINGKIFEKKNLLKTKCVFWFRLQILAEKVLISRIIRWNIVINVRKFSCKVPSIFVRFWWSLNFCGHVFEKKVLKYKISWKSVQWEQGCSMRTDRLTWRSWQSVFAILLMRLEAVADFLNGWRCGCARVCREVPCRVSLVKGSTKGSHSSQLH